MPTFYALITQMFRHLLRWQYLGRPVGIGLTRVAVLLTASAIPTYFHHVAVYHYSIDGLAWGKSNLPRAKIVAQLEAMPGQQLVIVRYSRTHHNVTYEWVYNAADIDHAKIVWAREVPGVDSQPLLDYFKGRTVWVVEPDVAETTPVRLLPYSPPLDP